MMKKPALLVVASFVTLLAGMTLLVRFTARPSLDTGSGGTPADIPLAVNKSLGITTDLTRYDEGSLESILAAVEASGMRILRQRASWAEIEARPGEFDWLALDHVVEAAARHGLTMIAVLDGSPRWARSPEDADQALAPPVHFEAFGAFAKAFALRYGDRIDHYQIWDEPNIAPHWGNREVSPESYARLLREGAIQIRTADPGAVILAAALAPNVEPGGANMSDLAFLDALYRAGGAEWFDVMAAQLYDFGEPLDRAPKAEVLSWRRVVLLRNVMLAHGDEATAVWAVSFGMMESLYSGTEAGLAGALRGAILASREEWPWLGPMLWAAWSAEDIHGIYALGDGAAPKVRVLSAFAELAGMLEGIAWPGNYAADHPSGRYDGDWRITPLGADIGATGDRLTIAFWGSRLDIRVRRGGYRAFLWVEVDGAPANCLPRDQQGRAYVVLYDPLHEEGSLTVACELPPGEHVAEIVAERGWGQWAVVGWAVSSEAVKRPSWPGAVISAVLLVVVVGAAWLSTKPVVRQKLSMGVLTLDGWLSRLQQLDPRLTLATVVGVAILTYAVGGGIPSLIGAGILGLLLCLCPELGLPAIALALPFYQLGVPLVGKVFSMVEILVLLTAAGWLLKWSVAGQAAVWRPGGILASLSWLDLGVGSLLVVAAFSLTWAEHTRVALREFRTVVLEAALFYGLLRATVRTRTQAWRVADAWVLGATAIALVGIVQWVFGRNVISTDGIWRVRGFYGSPNNLALYLGRVLPLGLVMVLGSRSGSRRLWYGLASGAIAMAIALSYSRGALLIGVPASLAFLVVLAPLPRRLRALVVAAVLVVVVVAVLVLASSGRLASTLDVTQGTTFFRLQLWRSSWAMVTDHPVLGVGLDNFLYQYRTRYVLPTAWEEFDLSHPHNFVLDFWLRLGLAGLLALVVTLVAFFRSGLRAFALWTSDEDRGLALGLTAGMVSFVAHGLVDNAFFLVDLAFSCMLAFALVQTEAFANGPSRVDARNGSRSWAE